ncbi:MAG: glycosyltransferase family 2 protein [Bacteriovoracaceae bacterium]|jgi:dolichol-phosphate mannosyltransferase|nr:glycosyltransferase family 2 protein [Bacteriovoracaceae bacterium]
MKILSIVIPAYNEEKFITDLLEKVLSIDTESVGYKKEIIVVDDCSKDSTFELASKFDSVKVFKLEVNQGKGAAVQYGVAKSEGDYILVQDADLEYNPDDYIPMLKALGPDTSVYGSRVLRSKELSKGTFFKSKHPDQELGPWLAGRILSIWAFFFFQTWISDTLTAYKIYPGKLLKSFNVKTNGFETDHELTAKLIKSGIKIIEVPIDYIPRSVEEGKKIKSSDFFIAVWTFLRFRFVN